VSRRVDLHDRLIALGSHESIRCGAPRHRRLGWDAVTFGGEVAMAILERRTDLPPWQASAMGSAACMGFPRVFEAVWISHDHARHGILGHRHGA
jgi:hypothetical protein